MGREKGPTEFERTVLSNYFRFYNGERAYREAGGTAKWGSQAFSEIKRRWPDLFADLQRQHREDIDARRQEIIDLITAQAKADVSEIIEVRRVNCRYCHGKNHGFQWKEHEWEEACDRYAREAEHAMRENKPMPKEPDPGGGFGFKKNLPPHEDCPKCDGEGVEDTFIKPWRDLSPAARAVLAGVEHTKDGIKIKFNSQEKARDMLAKMNNLYEKHQESGAVHVHLDDKDSRA